MQVHEGWTGTVIDTAIAQVDERPLEDAMTEVLVNAVADMWRDITNDAPQDCQTVGVDVVEKVVCGVNILEYDQPDIDW